MIRPKPEAVSKSSLQAREDKAIEEETVPNSSELFSIVYGELHSLAVHWFQKQSKDHTLQPTALVHEAFLRLVRGDRKYIDRTHLLATAACAMRQILVDHARGRAALKRGGTHGRVQLESLEGVPAKDGEEVDIERLHASLQRLEQLNARQAKIVELRFFAGLTIGEVAEVVKVSERTVKLDWQFARAWMLTDLKKSEGNSETLSRDL